MHTERLGLIDIRERHGLTRAQVATQMDVSEMTIGRWENGVSGIGTDRLRRLAALYQVSIPDLLRLFEGEFLDEGGNGPLAGEWEVPVGALPLRPSAALAGMSGALMPPEPGLPEMRW